jgi:hypothetical protein
MIEKYVDSVLIIDDVENEISGLREYLEKQDIWVKYYLPDDIKKERNLKNRKLIFLDLFLSKTAGANVAGHISEIRNILTKAIGKEFGSYGIVLWSAHNEEIKTLKQKINQDFQKELYTLPLFIIGLPKTKYLKEGFGAIFTDLDTEIDKNIAANFFIQWSNIVEKGRENAIANIYSLVNDFEKQDQNLKYLLFQLARNYTGIPLEDIIKNGYPLHIDSLKAFNNMLDYEITELCDSSTDYYGKLEDIRYIGVDNLIEKFSEGIDEKKYFENFEIIKKEEDKIYANGTEIKQSLLNKFDTEIRSKKSALNFKMHFDDVNLIQDNVVPGNIYKIKDDASIFKMEDSDIPKGAIPIMIEVSPPCDYSIKKRRKSRGVSGFICEITNKKLKDYSKEYNYKEVWPIEINGYSDPCMFIFDFRYFGSIEINELKNTEKYILMYRAKNKLFADILQKLAAHTSRLGLSIIH